MNAAGAERQGVAKSLTEQWNGLGKELRKRFETHLSSSNSNKGNEPEIATSTRHESDLTISKPPTTPMQFTAINKGPSPAVQSSRQGPQDSSSVTGVSVASGSSRSSTRKRECERCKKAQPLDDKLLVNCADCQRCFHKACVNPRDDLGKDGRWRCRKCTDRLRQPNSRIPPGHGADTTGPRSKQVTGSTSASTPPIASNVLDAGSSNNVQLKAVTEQQAIAESRTELPQELGRKDSHFSFQADDKQPEPVLSMHGSITTPPRVYGSPELGESAGLLRTNRSTPLSDVGTSTPQLGTGGTPVFGTDQAPAVPVHTPHPDAVPGERSTLSRVILIGMALLEAPGHRLQAQSIHEWIGRHIPGYHKSDKQMHNGVSNALSTRSRGANPLFEKQDPDGPGKPSWWAIKPGMEHKFKPWDHEKKCILGGGDETSMAPQKRKRQRLDQSFGTVTSDVTNESPSTADERNRLMIRLKLPRKSDAMITDAEMDVANEDNGEADPEDRRASSESSTTGSAPLKGASVQSPAMIPDEASKRDRSLSPFSSLIFRPPPRQTDGVGITADASKAPGILRTPQVSNTLEELAVPTQSTNKLGTSDILTLASTAPLVPNVSLANANQLSHDIGTQTDLLTDTSTGNINMLDGITNAANSNDHASASDAEYEARVLASITAKSQNFSVMNLSESLPASDTFNHIPQSVIEARPTKKQRMRMPGNEHISRLGHNTAVDRYKAICEHLGRKGGGDGSENEQGNEYGVADVDFENSQPTQCESLEELVEMPESVVPMLYDQQLVFTDGAKNKNARGRAGRAKNIYRIGANVLHR